MARILVKMFTELEQNQGRERESERERVRPREAFKFNLDENNGSLFSFISVSGTRPNLDKFVVLPAPACTIRYWRLFTRPCCFNIADNLPCFSLGVVQLFR